MNKNRSFQLTLFATVLVLTTGGALAEVAGKAPAPGFSTLQMIAFGVVGILLSGLQRLLGGAPDDDDADSSGGDGGGD